MWKGKRRKLHLNGIKRVLVVKSMSMYGEKCMMGKKDLKDWGIMYLKAIILIFAKCLHSFCQVDKKDNHVRYIVSIMHCLWSG